MEVCVQYRLFSFENRMQGKLNFSTCMHYFHGPAIRRKNLSIESVLVYKSDVSTVFEKSRFLSSKISSLGILGKVISRIILYRQFLVWFHWFCRILYQVAKEDCFLLFHNLHKPKQRNRWASSKHCRCRHLQYREHSRFLAYLCLKSDLRWDQIHPVEGCLWIFLPSIFLDFLRWCPRKNDRKRFEAILWIVFVS